MNLLIISGRLPQDCEIKSTQGGTTLCSFSVGVKSGYGDKEKTNWINCNLWGKRAEGKLPDYLKKGQEVVVAGELSIDKFEKDGQTKYFTKVNVDKLDLVGGGSNGRSQQSAPQAPPVPQAPADMSDFDDSSIPF